jgi:hypothetical protein
LADLYKANKDQVSVFGFRTQFGGGKSTGFALVYDSHEALKKFEPHYRLVRIGAAAKIEKASRQQRTSFHLQARQQDTDASQANNARTVPRSSEVPPRPRVPRRARTKSSLRRGDDGDTKKGVDNCIEFTKSGNKLLFFLLTPPTNITFFYPSFRSVLVIFWGKFKANNASFPFSVKSVVYALCSLREKEKSKKNTKPEYPSSFIVRPFD